MAYSVTTADIEDRWRPLTTEEDAVAAVLLADATVKLDTARPTLAAAVAASTVDERLVIILLCDMVIRVVSNPDLNRTINIGADGAIGITYALEVYRSRLGFAPGDLDQLDKAMSEAGVIPPKFIGRKLNSTMNYRTSLEP
jgi:hypothetical protein